MQRSMKARGAASQVQQVMVVAAGTNGSTFPAATLEEVVMVARWWLRLRCALHINACVRSSVQREMAAWAQYCLKRGGRIMITSLKSNGQHCFVWC